MSARKRTKEKAYTSDTVPTQIFNSNDNSVGNVCHPFSIRIAGEHECERRDGKIERERERCRRIHGCSDFLFISNIQQINGKLIHNIYFAVVFHLVAIFPFTQ